MRASSVLADRRRPDNVVLSLEAYRRLQIMRELKRIAARMCPLRRRGLPCPWCRS